LNHPLTKEQADTMRRWWEAVCKADQARSDFYRRFRERATGPVGQGFAIEVLPDKQESPK
jgi:hypothetical protein